MRRADRLGIVSCQVERVDDRNLRPEQHTQTSAYIAFKKPRLDQIGSTRPDERREPGGSE